MTGINSYIKTLKLQAMTPEEMAAHDAEIERLERQQAVREKLERYKKSGAPERYWNESLDTYVVSNAMQATAAKAATNFLHAVKCGEFKTLVMLGTAGTGKTHLACSILREIGGKYRLSDDIVEEMRCAKSFTSKDTEEEVTAHYAGLSLLVIDEIGRSMEAALEKQAIYRILNARYNRRKPSILISNFSKHEFLKYIGAASTDRLVESAEIKEISGDSYRLKKRGSRGTVL